MISKIKSVSTLHKVEKLKHQANSWSMNSQWVLSILFLCFLSSFPLNNNYVGFYNCTGHKGLHASHLSTHKHLRSFCKTVVWDRKMGAKYSLITWAGLQGEHVIIIIVNANYTSLRKTWTYGMHVKINKTLTRLIKYNKRWNVESEWLKL